MWYSEPASKGNPPLKDNDLGPIMINFINSYIGHKGISIHGKNLNGPMKALRAEFNCPEK